MKKFDWDNKVEEAQALTKLLEDNDVTYTVMKFWEGDYKDDDVDIVVARRDFVRVQRLLKKFGYSDWRKLKRGHIAHLREPLKIQFAPPEDKTYIAHLHQTFSWNGVEYLDPFDVHKRHVRNKYGFWVPSQEDVYLIIIAHSLFENNTVKKIEFKEFTELQKLELDHDYIQMIATRYNWEHVIPFFLAQKTTKLWKFRKVQLMGFKKLAKDIIGFRWKYIHREVISYFIISYFWCYLISIRKGHPIEG